MKVLFLGDFFYDYENEPSDFKEICKFIKDNDCRVILNLETSLSSKGGPVKKRGPNLFSSRSAIKALKDLNVIAVTLANNHVMDYGVEGLTETIKMLDVAGIKHLGAGSNIEEALRPLVLYVEGKRIIVTNYGWDIEETVYATKKTAGCAPLQRELIVKRTNDIKIKYPDAKLINIFHWGFEYNTLPMPLDIDFAHKCIDSGCDLIIGHHPHVMQPKEKYKKGVIYYSLGNFYFGNRRNLFNKEFPLEREIYYSNLGVGIKLDINEWKLNEYEIRYEPISKKSIISHATSRVVDDFSGFKWNRRKYNKTVKQHSQNHNPILTGKRIKDKIKIDFLFAAYHIYRIIKNCR